MKLLILYRPNSEHATMVEGFVHDYQLRNGPTKVEMISVDEREGIAQASLYDVMSFPAIMVTAADGSLLHMWSGPDLPLIDEVASYMFEA